MKKFVFALIIILALVGLIVVGGKTIWSGELSKFCKTNPSLLRFTLVNNLCVSANKEFTQKCSYTTHTCENVIPQEGSGSYKITITVNGNPGKGIEVDMGVNQGPTGDSFINTTDGNGIAIFKGIPPGVYYQSINLANFPKEYGDAYKSWTWATVTIVKGKITEMKMDLHSSQ